MYTVQIDLQTPAGNPTSRRVQVKNANDDFDAIIDKAHNKIKHLIKKGYKINGGHVN